MSSLSKSTVSEPKPADNVLQVSPLTSTSASAPIKSEKPPREPKSAREHVKEATSKISNSNKITALDVWRKDRERKWDTLARWSGDDLFPYSDIFSPSVDKTSRKYDGKLHLLKLQGEIQKLNALLAEENVKFEKMQENILPLNLQLEELTKEASNSAAILEAKKSEISELEAFIDIDSSAQISAADSLKARKAELKISKLRGELLEIEIKTIETGIALDLKNAEIEAEAKPVREAGSVLATKQYGAVLLKEDYKKAFLVWYDEFGDECSSSGHIEDGSTASNSIKAEEEVLFGESKEELVAALAEVESLSNQNIVLVAATKADADKLATLKAAENEIKSENTRLLGRIDILEKDIYNLRSNVKASQEKIDVLKTAEVTSKNEKISTANYVKLLEKRILDLNSDASADRELIATLNEQIMGTRNRAHELEKEFGAWKADAACVVTKSHVKGLYDEIDALRAREVYYQSVSSFNDENLLEENDKKITALDAALTSANTEQVRKKNTPDKTVSIAAFTQKEHESSEKKLKSVIKSLKYELACKKPLWIIGQKVRTRHNIQQMRNKWGAQFNFNQHTFNEGYECVNSGKAVADATLYQDDAIYKRNQRDYKEIYGVPAMVVLKYRNFGIFIQILNMGVDMKVYSPGGVPSASFSASFEMVLNRLSPSFKIASDREFIKDPELVEAFRHMCKQRSEVYYTTEYTRRTTLEHTWEEPAWIDRGYEGDHFDHYAE
ncbi:unnamed protein product [Diplocarpon coronariae]